MNPARRTLIALAALYLPALAACTPPASTGTPQILLFNGTGTSTNDVAVIAAILSDKGLDYSLVSSQQLNEMSHSQLTARRLLIIPGGNYIDMGNSLTPSATTNIRNAVQAGLNYLGICAGAILAGDTPSNSLNLTSGVRFDFYGAVNQNIHKAAVPIACVGMPVIDHYWEDGPQLAGWGEVVGKYPDGSPAIVQGSCGKGWAVLCGIHPEAPENWRHGMTFARPASIANAYAATLIDAALHRTRLPHY